MHQLDASTLDLETLCDFHRGYQSVWRGVILQALQDARSVSAKRCAQQAKREALVWLTEYRQDFVDVCIMAGFDPAYVYDQIGDALLRNWRRPAGTGWRTQQRLQQTLAKLRPASMPGVRTGLEHA